MDHTRSVSLDDHLNDFVDEQVEKGHYQSSDDVVRAGLQLLEKEKAKVEALRQALIEGEKGPFTEFDGDVILAEIHRKYLHDKQP